MLAFLQKIFESLDKNSKDEIVLFYTEFSKAFGKISQGKIGENGQNGRWRLFSSSFR